MRTYIDSSRRPKHTPRYTIQPSTHPPNSTCYGLERFSWVKMAGLLLSIGGTVLVGLADHNSGTDTVAGDALCLFAAIMYA